MGYCQPVLASCDLVRKVTDAQWNTVDSTARWKDIKITFSMQEPSSNNPLRSSSAAIFVRNSLVPLMSREAWLTQHPYSAQTGFGHSQHVVGKKLCNEGTHRHNQLKKSLETCTTTLLCDNAPASPSSNCVGASCAASQINSPSFLNSTPKAVIDTFTSSPTCKIISVAVEAFKNIFQLALLLKC